MRQAQTLDSAETRLLLCSARVCLDSQKADEMRTLVQRGIDWHPLLTAAQAHGIMPLLYWQLTRNCAALVPDTILVLLADRFRLNAARNLFLASQLLRLLTLLQSTGIGGIPFKGPTLAALAYGNLALRTSGDLDLLLRKSDIPRARELLAKEGFRSAFPLRREQEEAHLNSIGQLPLVSEDGKSTVDLHADIMPAGFFFPLRAGDVEQSLEAVCVAGQLIPTLCPEMLLVLLCAHGAKHVWPCLGWICDVAELIRAHPELDWEQVMKWATAWRSMRLLSLGLLLANDLLQAGLPPNIRRHIRADAVTRTLAVRVRERLFRSGGGLPNGFQSFLFHVKARERQRDGLRYGLRLVLGPTLADWTSVSLPASVAWAYPLFRPLRLAGKYSGKLLFR